MLRNLVYTLFLIPVLTFAQDIKPLMDQATQLESAFKENEAFLKYAEVLRLQPSNEIALCKCSELCSRIGARQSDKQKRLDLFNAAKVYAARALRINPQSSDANLVMAFAMARYAIVTGGKEKIRAVIDIRKYAEKAIQLDPENYKAYHVLGKWEYEVSNLNGVERTLAKWFYGGIPAASLSQAIIYFEKSRNIAPFFILNYLELARSYKRIGEKTKAIEFIKTMLPLPNLIADDDRAKQEGRKMLSELQ